MKSLPLSFTENTKFAGQNWLFELSEVDIMSASRDVTLYIDGKLYEGGISSFTENNLSAESLFESVFNSFLRGNTKEFVFPKVWDEEFAYAKALCVYDKDGLLKTFPQLRYDSFEMYQLELAVPDRRFYSHDEDFILMGKEGDLITDVEAFWQSAIEEDITDCLSGKTEALFMSDNVKGFIENGLGR